MRQKVLLRGCHRCRGLTSQSLNCAASVPPSPFTGPEIAPERLRVRCGKWLVLQGFSRASRAFVMRLEAAVLEPLEPLWADVTGLQLMADVLEAAFVRHGIKRRRRAATNADHAERTEAAKAYLAARMADNVSLGEVAAAVNASPFNFARIFQQQTGLPIHRYLSLLRLRASLERIAVADADLTTIALDLGFSSHSHFSDVFRREFGETPSEFRKNLSGKRISQMSKDLIA